MALGAPRAHSLLHSGTRVAQQLPRVNARDSSVYAKRWICRACRQNSDSWRTSRLIPAPQAAETSCPRKLIRFDTRWNGLASTSQRLFASSTRLRNEAGSSRQDTPSTSDSAQPSVTLGGGKVVPLTARESVNTWVQTTQRNWNELVGYTEIEKERKKVEKQGIQVSA